jgi:hypothetical protein
MALLPTLIFFNPGSLNFRQTHVASTIVFNIITGEAEITVFGGETGHGEDGGHVTRTNPT